MLITKNNCETGNNSTHQATSAHETSKSTTSIRRPRPTKPVKEEPVQYSGIISKENSLSMLHDFYMAAKKEIKSATTSSLHKDRDSISVTIASEGFELKLNFTERRTAL